MTVDQFNEALTQPYAWPGGYPRYFVTSDGAVLSYASATTNANLIRESIRSECDDGWRVVGVDINWEDPELYCDDSGDRIAPAYGDDA